MVVCQLAQIRLNVTHVGEMETRVEIVAKLMLSQLTAELTLTLEKRALSDEQFATEENDLV